MKSVLAIVILAGTSAGAAAQIGQIQAIDGTFAVRPMLGGGYEGAYRSPPPYTPPSAPTYYSVQPGYVAPSSGGHYPDVDRIRRMLNNR